MTIGQNIYHNYEKNADGSKLRARLNGKVKTWVTRPTHFTMPMKYGIKTCFYITHDDYHNWDNPSAYGYHNWANPSAWSMEK